MEEEKLASLTMVDDAEAPTTCDGGGGGGGGGDEDDEAVLQFLDSVDGYLTRMDSLSSTLRQTPTFILGMWNSDHSSPSRRSTMFPRLQGWFELASARQSMGPSRISSALFDLNAKSARTTLQMTVADGESPLEPESQFSLTKWASSRDDKCSSWEVEDEMPAISNSSQIRRRGSSYVNEADREINSTTKRSPVTVDNDKQKERVKSLSVFGTLVSPKLRTAQGSFETALETIVEIANLRSRVLSAYSCLQLEKATSV